MRILVINPNTTASMTEKIGLAARSVAAPGTEIRAVNPDRGPASIEGYYDEAFAVPGVIDKIREGEAAGFDGFVLACFDDTGLDAARCVTARPVIGICEAGMKMAGLVSNRFSAVTTLSRSVPALERLAERYGFAGRCRVRASEVAVLELEEPGSPARQRIRAEIACAMKEDAAEAILLGCAGMADLARDLAEEFQLPVIDGVGAAVKLAEAAVGLGLRTSKIGGYAQPRGKSYAGDLMRYQPLGEDEDNDVRCD